MASRLTVALAAVFLLSGASVASADQAVEPQPGVLMSGSIKFPRAQAMSVQTDPGDGSKLTAYLGFDGKCRGGGLSEIWASNIVTTPTVRVKNGKFSAKLTGTARNIGGVEGRTGHFRWKFSGRFIARDVVSATVTGKADVRLRGKKVATCKIASPASVRLAIRRA
jgi:hypothetical protein